MLIDENEWARREEVVNRLNVLLKYLNENIEGGFRVTQEELAGVLGVDQTTVGRYWEMYTTDRKTKQIKRSTAYGSIGLRQAVALSAFHASYVGDKAYPIEYWLAVDVIINQRPAEERDTLRRVHGVRHYQSS
jgi:hypothetical protein